MMPRGGVESLKIACFIQKARCNAWSRLGHIVLSFCQPSPKTQSTVAHYHPLARPRYAPLKVLVHHRLPDFLPRRPILRPQLELSISLQTQDLNSTDALPPFTICQTQQSSSCVVCTLGQWPLQSQRVAQREDVCLLSLAPEIREVPGTVEMMIEGWS